MNIGCPFRHDDSLGHHAPQSMCPLLPDPTITVFLKNMDTYLEPRISATPSGAATALDIMHRITCAPCCRTLQSPYS